MSGNIPSDAGAERRTFQIHSCLGRGGFGEVYRATMSSSGGVETEVAVKVLRADINPGSDSVKRLRDEGRLLGKLSHPSIVKVHDLVVLDGRVSLVTEYIEGEDLDTAWASHHRMSARALILAIGEVASALKAAWDSPSPISGEPLHLVHRDVKPANIRIGRHGEVKLLDFGIARAGNAVREAQTAANAMMGSYLYMAPERFHEDTVEPPSDVFALGSVTYEGLAGERFFGGMTLQQVYAFMLSSNRLARRLDERLAELAADCPEPVLALVRDMMDPEPEKRPTAGEVAHRCEDLAEQLEGVSLKRWCREREWSDPPDMTGSLDGRSLTAGTVGTHDPAPWRGDQAPVLTSGRIPNAPPPPTGKPVEYTPPAPQAVPPPKPQMLGAGAGPTDASIPTPRPSGRQSAPAVPTQPAAAGLGGPSLGDLSLARSDAGRDEPAFVFGDAETEERPKTWEREVAKHERRRGVWGLILGVGVMALLVVGVIAVGAIVVVSDPSLIGAGGAAPILDAPIEDDPPDGEAIVEPTPPEDGAADGEGGTDQPDEGTPEPEPEPAPEADPEPVAPAPAPAPTGPTARSLTNKGWNSMGDPGAALELFRQALDLDSDYGDAHYGAGYALVELGRADEGKASLCRGRSLVDAGTRNEIDGILEQHGLSCD